MSLLRPPRAPFEPPRAGATHGIWNAWYAFLRRMRLRLPRLPAALKPNPLTTDDLVVAAIPTYGWFALGRTSFALGAAAVYVVCALTAILCLGWTAGGWAAGIMITLHALGVAEYFYSGKLWPEPNHRLPRYVGVFLAVAIAYWAVGHRLVALVVVPMETERGAILINPTTSPKSLTRSETVAFHRKYWRASNFALRDGLYIGEVLGLPGDVIVFSGSTFAVNGQTQPRRTAMPKTGGLTVPANHLFIWPFELRRDLAFEPDASSLAQNVALVPNAELLGRPYRRWFFRRQGP